MRTQANTGCTCQMMEALFLIAARRAREAHASTLAALERRRLAVDAGGEHHRGWELTDTGWQILRTLETIRGMDPKVRDIVFARWESKRL